MATPQIRAGGKKRWSFTGKILTLYFALKEARSPWYARLTAFLSLVYLLSPIDFIPDIITFAGYVDDLLVVPFLLNISGRLMPADVRLIAEKKAKNYHSKARWMIACVIVLLVVLMVLMFMLAKTVWHQLADMM